MREPSGWWFAWVYPLHQADEWFVGQGLPAWSTDQAKFYFTEQHWLIVNAVSLALFCGAAALVARRVWPAWLLLSLATHIAAHAVLHLGGSLYVGSLSPGSTSGLLACLPLAAWTALFFWRALEPRHFVRAVAVGVLTVQAVWDVSIRLVFGLQWYAG